MQCNCTIPGKRAKEEMQADQFLDAKDDGVEWIGRGFVEAWRPVTQRVQVIAYIGMLPKNDRFEGLLQRGDCAGLQAVTDSYRLPLDAKMDIAFDALHMVNPDGWELQVQPAVYGDGCQDLCRDDSKCARYHAVWCELSSCEHHA